MNLHLRQFSAASWSAKINSAKWFVCLLDAERLWEHQHVSARPLWESLFQ